MSGMFVKYGQFVHPPGEVTLVRFQVVNETTPRGFNSIATYSAVIEGYAKGCTEYEVNQRLAQIIDGYATDGLHFGLYHSDGSMTRHQIWGDNDTIGGLPIADVVQGTMVLSRSYPETGAGEFVSGRKFRFTLEGKRHAQVVIVDFQETIRHTGMGSAVTRLKNTQVGINREVLYPNSPQRIIQTGRSIGLTDYIYSFPLLAAPYEDESMRVLKPGTPKHFRRRSVFYPHEWRYVFNCETPQFLLPVHQQIV